MSVPPLSKLRRDMSDVELAQAISRDVDREQLGSGHSTEGWPFEFVMFSPPGVRLEWRDRWLFWKWADLDAGKQGKDVTPDWLADFNSRQPGETMAGADR